MQLEFVRIKLSAAVKGCPRGVTDGIVNNEECDRLVKDESCLDSVIFRR